MAKLTEDLARAADWLVEIRDEQSGGWGEYKGAGVSSLNTAEAILALVAVGHAAGDEVVQRGRAHLVNRQVRAAADQGAWTRTVELGTGEMRQTPDSIRSALALLALNAAGAAASDAPMAAGVGWLLRIQNADRGWGYSSGQPSKLYPSCLVLQAALRLLQAGGVTNAAALRQTAIDAVQALVNRYARGDGSFGDQAGLEMVHTLAVLKTLAQAQAAGLPVQHAVVEAARRWARQRPAEATRWGNETVQLTADGAGDYTFTHITPALYLDAMTGDPPTNAATRESLVVIADNLDVQTGAFGSKRPVSWSTAKTLYGLAAVKDAVTEFPERDSPPGQQSQRTYLFFGILSLALVATVVNLFGKLSGEYLGLLSLIIFALLLVYGALSESSFVELARSLMPGGKKKESG